MIDLKGDTYINEVICQYDDENEVYIIYWCDEKGNYFKNYIRDMTDLTGVSKPEKAETFSLDSISVDIEGVVPGNIINVSRKIAHRLICKLTVPTNIRIETPDRPSISSMQELNNIRAKAIYSDGTTASKKVDWNTEGINWDIPGTYHIKGRVYQDYYPFPIAINRADPCIGKWNGKYYYIATNDADDNNTLYIREADSIRNLIDAEEVLILDTETHDDVKGLLWAPEFHIIKGNLYIFHGASTTGEF